MKYELTKELETGNSIIDREHRELFQAVNQLMDSCGYGKGRAAMEPAIKFLLDYVDKHFAHEEQLQQASGYPGMMAHKTFHRQYTQGLREAVAAIPAGGPSISDLANLNRYVTTLITHIKIEDKKLSAFLKQA
ncbi:MAG: hemerythrin family protein [Lawsonibacter sp.]|nr:hemerythrin family protein [Lawsonibacter sp.]